MNQRIEQLDSMRGIAAFCVLLSHLPLLTAGLSPRIAKYLPLVGVTNGEGAVMLFFVLSGLVLSFPIYKYKSVDYFPYLVKRIFRIYIPYLFAISLAIILSQIFLNHKLNLPELSVKLHWNTPLTWHLILEHIIFIGNIHSNAFNGVIWSLIQEMRISLIFPFVVLLVNKLNFKLNVLLIVILLGVAGINCVIPIQISNGFQISYFNTFGFLAIFILGSLLAKHISLVVRFYQKLNLTSKISLLIIAFSAFNLANSLIDFLYNHTRFVALSAFHGILADTIMALGAVGFLAIAISSITVKRILLTKPIAHLGKISFSLYLFHVPVLMTCIYLLYRIIPLWIICLITIILSISLATITYYSIELPFMNKGKRIANRINVKNKLKLPTTVEVVNK